ncbi:unnamed protein product [Parajaminaea phylloscopi]
MAAPTSQIVTLTEDAIDDLLYCARAGETTDLAAYLDEVVQSCPDDKLKAKQSVVEQVKDQGGNGMAHYACANGHLATFEILSPLLNLQTILLQNSSGNTPLHWAGLNGHLSLVKALIARIADLERQNPEEASRINVLKHEQEAAVAAAKKRKQRQAEEAEKEHKGQASSSSSSSATTTAPTTAPDADVDADADEGESTAAEAPDRSLWDIRNNAGRGPTSESQMNGKEDVVVYLLSAMGAESAPSGGSGSGSAPADPTPQPTNERVDLESDTPPPPQPSSRSNGLETQAGQMSLSSDDSAQS